MKVSCFGDTLSHTYAAAVALFGDGGLHCEIVGCDTIFDTLACVRRGETARAVVPIENSYEGTVVAAEDALGELGLYVEREIVLPVRQSLIAQAGVALSDVRTVYSHPQALAQCKETLRALLPQARTEAVPFTSAGLRKLSPASAALARAPMEGQTVLAENLADSPLNCTRFLSVSATPQHTGNKVSVRFSTQNRPGALLAVLRELEARHLNMTKIESRPAKKRMGQYVFYADFLFDGTQRDLTDLMSVLENAAEEVRYLGRYEQYEPQT